MNAAAPEDREAMRRCYLFSGLSDADYLEASHSASPVSLHAGQMLFSQDAPADAFYWVADGVIRLFRASPQGEEKVIELIPAQRLFAEAVLFMGGRYPVNAVAQTAARLVRIDGAAFKHWLAQDATRCFRLMGGMSARMHKLIKDIDSLTLMKGTERLLQYLIDHSEPADDGRHKVELEAPKQVIASRIGVKPETLSRMFHKMTDLGWIEVAGHTLYLKDPEQLLHQNLE